MFIQYIHLGKPNQNAFVERFDGTFRYEVLDLYLLNHVAGARDITHW